MSETTDQAEGKPRGVRFTDDELVDLIRDAVIEDGIRTAGAAEKHFRSQGRGSNGQRVRRAWAQAAQIPAVAKVLDQPAAQGKADRDARDAEHVHPEPTPEPTPEPAKPARKATRKATGSRARKSAA
jgi:hypothetical protein